MTATRTIGKGHAVLKIEVPIEITQAAKEVVRLAELDECHGNSYFNDEAIIERLLYVRWLGFPGYKTAVDSAGICPDTFRRTLRGLRNDFEAQPRHRKKFWEFWCEFGAETKIEMMQRLRANSLASDNPKVQKEFLEFSDKSLGAKPEQHVREQTNIQINDNRTEIEKITDATELVNRMKKIQEQIPPDMIETTVHDPDESK